jgi:hypothetical protein
MPRFTLKDLLLAITLVTLGIAGTTVVYRTDWTSANFSQNLIVISGSWMAMGAGFAAPIQQKKRGAFLGAIAAFLWLLLSPALHVYT